MQTTKELKLLKNIRNSESQIRKINARINLAQIMRDLMLENIEKENLNRALRRNVKAYAAYSNFLIASLPG